MFDIVFIIRRLEWKSREQQQAIETEISEREEFVTELMTLKDALSEVKATLEKDKDGEGVNQVRPKGVGHV